MKAKEIFEKKTGITAWSSSDKNETGLTVYVEAPTEEYLRWLEKEVEEKYMLKCCNGCGKEMVAKLYCPNDLCKKSIYYEEERK